MVNFHYINVEVYVYMFRNPESGAIDMVSLILTEFNAGFNKNKREMLNSHCRCYDDGRSRGRCKYGTLNARNHALSPQLFADKRSYQHWYSV